MSSYESLDNLKPVGYFQLSSTDFRFIDFNCFFKKTERIF